MSSQVTFSTTWPWTWDFVVGVNLADDIMNDALIGAELGIKYINSRSDILPNTTLRIIANISDSYFSTMHYIQQSKKQT